MTTISNLLAQREMAIDDGDDARVRAIDAELRTMRDAAKESDVAARTVQRTGWDRVRRTGWFRGLVAATLTLGALLALGAVTGLPLYLSLLFAIAASFFIGYGTFRAADPNAAHDPRAGVHNGGLNYWRGGGGGGA